MKRLTLLALAWVSVGVLTADAPADTWCSINHPGAVFCDDFDRYCVDPPPEPQACSDGSSVNNKPMLNVWRYGYDGAVPCSQMLVDTDFETSPPYAGKSPNQDSALTRAQVSLENYCAEAFGTNYRAIVGTDLNPLYLEFVIDGQTGNKIRYANNYMELALGMSQAPTDFRNSPKCSTVCAGGSDAVYPIICQQQNAPAGCPSLSTASHRASLAVGALAYLDKDPCHCSDLSIPYSYNTHLSFFDGYQWWILREGLFPGSGDFLLRNRTNRVRLTILSTTVKVELTCTDPSPDEYSWCIIPRDYQGEFSKLYAGIKSGCQLRSGQWECISDEPKCMKGVPGGGVPRYDNVSLWGGQGYAAPGACCFGDTSCIEAYAADCEIMGGEFQGTATPCATAVCCATFRPDADLDSDVDLADFAYFQNCLTGADLPLADRTCKCADLNGDGDVDRSDMLRFFGCLSGMNIAADPSCAN